MKLSKTSADRGRRGLAQIAFRNAVIRQDGNCYVKQTFDTGMPADDGKILVTLSQPSQPLLIYCTFADLPQSGWLEHIKVHLFLDHCKL